MFYYGLKVCMSFAFGVILPLFFLQTFPVFFFFFFFFFFVCLFVSGFTVPRRYLKELFKWLKLTILIYQSHDVGKSLPAMNFIAILI